MLFPYLRLAEVDMQREEKEKQAFDTSLWILGMVCVAVVVFALCAGTAYTAVRSARLSAARASIGQIEAVLFLAEKKAEQDGLGPPPSTYSNLLRSYDDTSAGLTAYEKYVLAAMLESFGTSRDFDFAVMRYEDASGVHTQVYFFPVRGQTDRKKDRYYQMKAEKVIEGGD